MNVETDIELSVLLTLHSETLVAGPTLKSIEAALAVLERNGVRLERLLGVDSPTEECLSYINQPAFENWQTSLVEFRDQGQTRNNLIKKAKGRFIAVMDGDDLCSENWLAVAADTIVRERAAGLQVVVHPELRWTFDHVNSVAVNIPSNDKLFAPDYLKTAHTYDSLVMSTRETFIQTPYRCRQHAEKLGYEDWAWTLDTLEKGVTHIVAKDTIIFKRRRDSSLLSDLSSNQTLLWPHRLNSIDFDWDHIRGAT